MQLPEPSKEGEKSLKDKSRYLYNRIFSVNLDFLDHSSADSVYVAVCSCVVNAQPTLLQGSSVACFSSQNRQAQLPEPTPRPMKTSGIAIVMNVALKPPGTSCDELSRGHIPFPVVTCRPLAVFEAQQRSDASFPDRPFTTSQI